MTAAVAEAPYILHELPGRMRVHLPDWTRAEERALDHHLRRLAGVRGVQLNAVTGNLLLRYDPAQTSAPELLGQVRALAAGQISGMAIPHEEAHLRPAVVHERHGHTRRARIAVPGIDRDPQLARHVVEHLARQPGVQRAVANPITGRVLVEFTAHEADVDDLIAQVMNMELPDLPEEDEPAHPLDPAPVVQSAARTVGATVGLGLVALTRVTGNRNIFSSAEAAGQVAGILGILRGLPFIRNGSRQLLGRNTADLLFTLPNIVALVLSDSPLGLALTGLESVRLLTEVLARQRTWRQYEARLGGMAHVQPGAEIRIESGERVPLEAEVVAGTGTATRRNGQPQPVTPGGTIPAGAKVYGGPFVVRLKEGQAFTVSERPAPLMPTLYDRYVRTLAPASLLYALATGLLTRSWSRAFTALLLVNPRTAVIGMEAANLDANARVLRGGVTIVGTRPERTIRVPDLLLFDGPRLFTDGYEVRSVVPLREGIETADLAARAAAVAAAAGSPWGGAFRASTNDNATDGAFDGQTAGAVIGGERYTLGPVARPEEIPPAIRLQQHGNLFLALANGRGEQLGIVIVRPRLAHGALDLAAQCRRLGVTAAVVAEDEALAAREIARRMELPLMPGDTIAIIRAHQQQGKFVALVADSAHAGAAFAACDLAIGVVEPRHILPARADLLVPDLPAVGAILAAGAQRDAAVRDSVGLSALANALGAAWGVRGQPGILAASRIVYGTAIAAIADGWARLRGGARREAALAHITDPQPERWGQRSVAETLSVLNTSATGLTSGEAARRREIAAPPRQRGPVLRALLEQVRSPLTLLLAGAAGVSLLLGSAANALLIGATVAGNMLVGVWQEQRVNAATESLARMNRFTARVEHDGLLVTVPADQVVPGDILVLEAGDRIPADARLITASHLEVDEAALTGESLPVTKAPAAARDAARVVLNGSDVTTGTGRAVAFAVGPGTRMGAIAAALAVENVRENPLDARLSRMLRLGLPLAGIAGAIVTGMGVLRGGMLLPQLVIGATIAISAIPEGLPALAQMSQVGVAQRLARRGALVRRLTAVEALGRVDVACTDKTGTLTEGKIALSTVADTTHEATLTDTEPLPADLARIVLTAACASPHPDAPGASAHPTDVAVLRGAERAGLSAQIRAPRQIESPFDPVRGFHSALVEGRLCVKGAPEVLAPRCTHIRTNGTSEALDDARRRDLLDHATRLSQRGLRVLLVAEGAADGTVEQPHDLTALGYIGLSDPLRPSARRAVEICHQAGIRVVMLTGDHPATARAIASQAGLLQADDEVITGAELAELHNGELDARLAHVTVIARATPVDKLRIIESMQRRQHVVAMTGDGVNDAPALRLADVGVAMGLGGTEVARQTADVVLMDDNFATLVDALVEGRSFWGNMRRALGLLIGGNLGELVPIVGASLLGLGSPLTASQVLGVNFVTDVLPGLAVALQQPAQRNLAGLAREGASALDRPLRNDILRRTGTTGGTTLAAYLAALALGGPAQASTVAFSSMIGTQLAQTLEASRTADGISIPIAASVAGSASLLVAALLVPPLRTFLQLVIPSPLSLGLIAGAVLVSTTLNRALAGPATPPPLPSATTQPADATALALA